MMREPQLSIKRTFTSNSLLKNRLLLSCLVVIFAYIIMAILAHIGLIASDFALTNTNNSYAGSSSLYWFGTDIFGRNILSRAIHGSITALSVGFFSTILATLIGTTLGSIAAYFGGFIDTFIIWLYTTISSIPYILLISAFAFALGQGLISVYLALGLTSWVSLCRLIRAEVLKHKNSEYVQAAKAIGSSPLNTLTRHILPNVSHLILVQSGIIFVMAIKSEVLLSFLGLGVEIGTPSWGTMINDARLEIPRGFWGSLSAATLMMFILILAVNLLNDTIRETLDPKTKGNG